MLAEFCGSRVEFLSMTGHDCGSLENTIDVHDGKHSPEMSDIRAVSADARQERATVRFPENSSDSRGSRVLLVSSPPVGAPPRLVPDRCIPPEPL